MEENARHSDIFPPVCDASVQCGEEYSQLSPQCPNTKILTISSDSFTAAENDSNNLSNRRKWRMCDTLSSISSLEQQDTESETTDNVSRFDIKQYRNPEGASEASDPSLILAGESDDDKSLYETNKADVEGEIIDSANNSAAEPSGESTMDITAIIGESNITGGSGISTKQSDAYLENSTVETSAQLHVNSDTVATDNGVEKNADYLWHRRILDANKHQNKSDTSKCSTTDISSVGTERNSTFEISSVSYNSKLDETIDLEPINELNKEHFFQDINSDFSGSLPTESKTDDMYSNLMKVLQRYYPSASDITTLSPENTVTLLEECLQYYKQKVTTLTINVKQLEKEVDNVQQASLRKQKRIAQEHKERLCRLAKDHEDELRAAVERAVNARQQSVSLQEQLDSVQAKLETTEKEAIEETKSTIKKYKEQLAKWGEEKQNLFQKVTELDSLLKDKSKEVSTLHMINDSLRKQSLTESKSDKDYLEHLEKELAKERARYSTIQSELQQEKEHNRYLWSEARKRAQQMASLQSRLEALCSDVSHRDRLLAILKEEILAKVTTHTEQEKHTLQSLDLLNDNAVNEKWSEVITESLLSKDAKIQQLRKEMNDKELLLLKLNAKLKEQREELTNIQHEIKQTEEEHSQKRRELSTKKLDLYELELNLTRTMNLMSDRSMKLDDVNRSTMRDDNYTPASSPSSSKKHCTPQSDLGHKRYSDKILDLERQSKYFQQQCKNRDKQLALLQQDLESKDQKIIELTQLLEIERGNINYISGPDLVCFPKTKGDRHKGSAKPQEDKISAPSRLSSKLSGRGSPLGAEGPISKQKLRRKTRPKPCQKISKNVSDAKNLSSSDESSSVASTATYNTKSVTSEATTASQANQTKNNSNELAIPVCPRHASQLGEDHLSSLSFISSVSNTPITNSQLKRTLFTQEEDSRMSSRTPGGSSQQNNEYGFYHSTPSDQSLQKDQFKFDRLLQLKKKVSVSSTMVQTD